MMWHAREIARLCALIAVSTFALGLTGAANATVARQVTAATVTVTFTDTTLRVSPVNPGSGSTRFVVLNKGKKLHVLAIVGPVLRGVHTGKVAAGSKATLTVNLRRGVYVLSDPVGLGTFTSAFLSVVRSAVLTAQGNHSEVQPEVEVPPMCGMYFTP
jgi:hypothetical protein